MCSLSVVLTPACEPCSQLECVILRHLRSFLYWKWEHVHGRFLDKWAIKYYTISRDAARLQNRNSTNVSPSRPPSATIKTHVCVQILRSPALASGAHFFVCPAAKPIMTVQIFQANILSIVAEGVAYPRGIFFWVISSSPNKDGQICQLHIHMFSLFLSLFLPPSFSSSVWSSDRIKQWGLNPGQLRWLCVASDDTCLDSPPLHARWVAGWRSPLRRRWNRLPALSALKCSLTSHHPDVEKARQPLSFSFCYTLRSPEGNKTNKQTKKRYLPSGVFVWFRPAFGSRLLFAL